MKQSRWNKLVPAALAALAGATLISACSREMMDSPAGPAVRQAQPLELAVELSRTDASAGQRVAVAIRAITGAGDVLGGLQGRLNYDASRLRLVGQSADADAVTMLNTGSAGRGELMLISLNPRAKELRARTAVLQFEVLAGDYAGSLRYTLGAASDPSGRMEFARASYRGVVVAPDLRADDAAMLLSDDQWARVVDAALADQGGRIYTTPGEYTQNDLKYGDCNLSGGSINVFDVLCIARMAVSADALISGSDSPDRDGVLAGNVSPENLPGIGEIGDATPPGIEGGGSAINIDTRRLNVFDALLVANDALTPGFSSVVGAVIPGREVSQAGRPIVNVVCPILTSQTWVRTNIYRIGPSANTVCQVGTNGGGTAVVLTIEAGTRVELDDDILLIDRNAQIQALGTLADPIVFTCQDAVPTPGCWGGLYINGNATINNGTAGSPAIAGRQAGGALQAVGEGNSGNYGGDNDADNSGTVRFVIVEFGGFIFSGTNERNGFTLQGVGSGTTVDYVMADQGRDDGIEMFGGTVNIKHVVVNAHQDDGIDWVGGWRGNLQFGIVRGCSSGCDNGIEADNFGIDGGNVDPEASPRSAPTLYNLTLLGVNNPTQAYPSGGFHGMLLRQNTGGTIRNFLAFGWKAGIDVDSTGQAAAHTGPATLGAICANLASPGNILSARFGYLGQNTAQGDGDNDSADPRGTGTSAPFSCGGYSHAGSDLEAAYIATGTNSLFGAQGLATAHIVDPWGAIPDYRLLSSSPIATATCATPPSNGFFDVTATYCGAVPAQSTTLVNIPWYSGWTKPRN
ncbi:MAG: hypothetical protein HOP28_10860 [Gemmatimonadales bacterium]|nr:hypothetical protein [Gemmatimonadales bacterium]